MLGPLYHLTERRDRVLAWSKAARVRPTPTTLLERPFRRVSPVDGFNLCSMADPGFVAIVEEDLR